MGLKFNFLKLESRPKPPLREPVLATPDRLGPTCRLPTLSGSGDRRSSRGCSLGSCGLSSRRCRRVDYAREGEGDTRCAERLGGVDVDEGTQKEVDGNSALIDKGIGSTSSERRKCPGNMTDLVIPTPALPALTLVVSPESMFSRARALAAAVSSGLTVLSLITVAELDITARAAEVKPQVSA